MKIRYLKQDALQNLAETIEDNLHLYISGEFDTNLIDGEDFSFESKTGSVTEQDLLTIDLSRAASKEEAYNALILYQSLNGITRYQATDTRLWTYLAHRYGLRLFLNRYCSEEEKQGKSNASLIEKIKKHVFANTNMRMMIRQHVMARLWWSAQVAMDVDSANTLDVLEILDNFDLRASIIERTGMHISGSHRAYLKFCLKKKIEGDNDFFVAPRAGVGSGNTRHYQYRLAAKFLNRVGGYKNLHIFSDEEIILLISEDEKKYLANRI